jgi:hypothetical protein
MIIRTTRTIRIRKTNPARTVRTARRTVLQILLTLTARTITKRTTSFSGFGKKALTKAPFLYTKKMNYAILYK